MPEVAVEKGDTADSCLVSWTYKRSVTQMVHLVNVVGQKFRQNINSNMRYTSTVVTSPSCYFVCFFLLGN